MIDETVMNVSGFVSLRTWSLTVAASCLVSLLLTTSPAPVHAANGDCSQPVSAGSGPSAPDCLFILRAAVGAATCPVPCVCAPKGALPVSASDALLCLRKAVGQSVVLNCPCDPPTTTTILITTTTTTLPSGVVGAIPFQGRMNANQQLGLPAATAACEQEFPGSHYCEYSEIVASQGAGLVGLQDTENDTVTSFWAIDPVQSVARQCGQSLTAGAPRWVYNTGHVGVGGDSAELDNDTGMLGTLDVGGGANRNCFDSKWVACCR